MSSNIGKRTIKPGLILGTLLLGLVLLPAVAWADEYDAAFARAIAAKERALDKNDPASWQDAIDLFEATNEIRATKEAKYELGSAAARLRQDDIAVEAYEAAVELGIEGTARDKASAFVEAKRTEMARVAVKGPAGAEIWVGDRRRGRLPLDRPLVVFAGKRTIRVTEGDRSKSEPVTLAAGESKSLDFGATLPDPKTPSVPGTPGNGGSLPPIDDSSPRDTGHPGPDRSLGWTLTLGGGGLAVVGVATALIASTQIGSHRDRLSTLCAKPSGSDSCTQTDPQNVDAAQKEVDSIATWKAVRLGGYFGIGAGLIGAGVGIVILSSSDERGKKAPPTSFGLVPAPGGATLSVRGAL